MRSHYGPLGRTRGANPPDLSSIPGPCTKLHFFFLSFGAHPPIARSIHGVFGMGTQTGAHPPGPPFESRASKFSFFILSFRIIPPLDKRFTEGNRINTQSSKTSVWSGPPFCLCSYNQSTCLMMPGIACVSVRNIPYWSVTGSGQMCT